MRGLRASRWSPYAVGAGIGVVSWFAFATAHRGLDVTPPFEDLSGMLERALAPGWSNTNGWFLENEPGVGWEWTLLVGIFLGSFGSARLAESPGYAIVPPLWRRRFGRAASRRLAWSFGGGALMMFGARLAHGCTMGHGVSGALALAVASWAFIAVASASAVATAFTLFGAVGGRGGGGRARLPR